MGGRDQKASADDSRIPETCTPGYYNNEGKADIEAGRFGGDAYAPGANAFNALLAQWREKGDLAGLELNS